VDADEDVGPVVPGDLEAFFEGDIVVARPREEGLVALAPVEVVAQLLRNLEDDVLLARPHLAHGPGVFAAVPRVDDDDLRLLELLDLLAVEALLLLDLGELQVDDDAVGLVEELLELEDLRLHVLREGDLDADALVGQRHDVDLLDAGLVQEALQGDVLGDVGLLHRQGQPAAFLGHGVGRLVARVDDDARVVRRGPVADVGHVDEPPGGGCQKPRQEQRCGKNGCEESCHFEPGMPQPCRIYQISGRSTTPAFEKRG